MTDLIGDLLLEEARRRSGGSPRIESFLDWLREAARPPPGVELLSADGSLFTGIVIVDRNRPVAMLAARQTAAPRPRSPAPSPYHGSPYTTYQPRLFDEEDEAERHGEPPPWWRR